MTLQEIKDSDKMFLLPQDITEVMGSNAQSIRLMARAGTIGFPVTFSGNRTKIPRIPFLRYLGVIV